MKKLIYAILIPFLCSMPTPHLEAKSGANENKEKGSSIYNLKANWINQDGAKMSLQQLGGKPVVLAMIYTSCPSACPMTISDIKKIEQRISSKAKNQPHFILISFDSNNDNPKKLMEFSKKYHLDLKQWTLLTGTKNEIRELAMALGVQYRQNPDGSFAHSNVITLIDPDGIIRYQQTGLKQDPGPLVEVLNQIKF